MGSISVLLGKINMVANGLGNIEKETRQKHSLFLDIKLFFSILKILLYGLWTVRVIRKGISQIPGYDKDFFSDIYRRIAFVRDKHIALIELLNTNWFYRLLSGLNREVLSGFDDLAEDLLFASDEQLHEFVSDVAKKL